MTRKKLREQLRLAGAKYKPEPNDTGKQSFLETARQFIRDYQHDSPKWTPKFKAEVKRILEPVLRGLS